MTRRLVVVGAVLVCCRVGEVVVGQPPHRPPNEKQAPILRNFPTDPKRDDITIANLDSEQELGIASRYYHDQGIANDEDVIAAIGFEDDRWKGTLDVSSQPDTIFAVAPSEPIAAFQTFQGRAVAVKVKQGTHYGGSLGYYFAKHHQGQEPESSYFRYYLRFGQDWDGRGGKLPGFGGTYNRGGWGGKPSDGRNGWSARGTFSRAANGQVQIGTYCYHAEMTTQYGSVWRWDRDRLGTLDKNRWYCIEQHLHLNQPGSADGVIRAWVDGKLAFSKTDIRFRDTDKLGIERIWLNVYHGGKDPAASDDHLFIDNVVIANRYIGPLRVSN
jgi:hypothetical protein